MLAVWVPCCASGSSPARCTPDILSITPDHGPYTGTFVTITGTCLCTQGEEGTPHTPVVSGGSWTPGGEADTCTQITGTVSAGGPGAAQISIGGAGGEDTVDFTLTTARHSVWGTATPAGTFAQFTDGAPGIEYGNCFYRFAGGSGTGYPNMRIVGAKVFKPAAITPPAGTATVRIYTNPGPLPNSGVLPTSFGTKVMEKTVPVGGMVDGWNTVLADAPLPMAPNGGVVIVTVVWNGNDDVYITNSNARAAQAALQASDGTKLAWSDAGAPGTGYFSAVFRLTSGTFGVANANNRSYGTDLLVDEGA